MSAKKTMKLWRCPKCKMEIEAIATEVSHRCNPKATGGTTTRFELVEGK